MRVNLCMMQSGRPGGVAVGALLLLGWLDGMATRLARRREPLLGSDSRGIVALWCGAPPGWPRPQFCCLASRGTCLEADESWRGGVAVGLESVPDFQEAERALDRVAVPEGGREGGGDVGRGSGPR